MIKKLDERIRSYLKKRVRNMLIRKNEEPRLNKKRIEKQKDKKG
jgi:hypothetical protein